MKYWILIFCFFAACSNHKIESPEEVGFHLQLATEGVGRFEDYIHSLNIYAFRKTADRGYVYDRSLAELDASGISGLQDGSARGDSKVFEMNLPVGTYKFYMVGNGAGQITGNLVEDQTTPGEVFIQGNLQGQDSVFFLGHAEVTLLTDERAPIAVTLNRVVSKLVLVLYGVPVQIDSVHLTLGNLASRVSLDETYTGEGKSITKNLLVRQTEVSKDTLVGEVLTLPSLASGSPLRLTFYAENGQVRVKDMPVQTLLPDKYVRVAGIINEDPGGLLSFEMTLKFFLFDYWYEQTLPDFVLNKGE